MKHVTLDERRKVSIASTEEEAYEYCAHTFIEQAQKAISSRAHFCVAVSGGQTPVPFFEALSQPSFALLVNWSLLDIFWVDERCVPADDPESNYGNARTYWQQSPLDQAKKHPLKGDSTDKDRTAREYEKRLKKACPGHCLDMALLGIGDDGHTASLFPNTQALHENKRLYVANHVPSKDSWRLTMTFPAIDQTRALYVLALGRGKSKILKKIFFSDYNYEEIPAQRIGTKENPATFIIDKKAAYGLGL